MPEYSPSLEEDINKHDMEVAMEMDASNVDNVTLPENDDVQQMDAMQQHITTIYDQVP